MEGEGCNLCGAPTVIDYGIGAGAGAGAGANRLFKIYLNYNGRY